MVIAKHGLVLLGDQVVVLLMEALAAVLLIKLVIVEQALVTLGVLLQMLIRIIQLQVAAERVLLEKVLVVEQHQVMVAQEKQIVFQVHQ